MTSNTKIGVTIQVTKQQNCSPSNPYKPSPAEQFERRTRTDYTAKESQKDVQQE